MMVCVAFICGFYRALPRIMQARYCPDVRRGNFARIADHALSHAASVGSAMTPSAHITFNWMARDPRQIFASLHGGLRWTAFDGPVEWQIRLASLMADIDR
jgi:hypothetical protein